MNNEIILVGVDSDLILETVVNKYGWTSCYLAKGQERIFLGAESIGFIVTRLLEGLNEQSSSSEMKMEGEKVRCILALSERHHVLYATFGKSEQKLFWQDADENIPKVAGIITLQAKHREQWLQQLGSLKDKWSKTPQWNSR